MKQVFALLTVLALSFTSSSCGGGGIGSFDEFQPRAALVTDFSGKTFDFTWLPASNPIHAELGEMTIVFGTLNEDGEGQFSLQEHGAGSVSGTVDFDSPNLSFTVTSKLGDIPLSVGNTITNLVEADIADGRIRLTNTTTDAELTSDP